MARLTLNQTLERLLLLIRAGYPVIYLVSHEESRVLDYLARIIRVILNECPGKHLLTWYEGEGFAEVIGLTPVPQVSPSATYHDWLDIAGLREPQPGSSWRGQKLQTECKWPDEALKAIRTTNLGGDPIIANSLAVFYDLHPYLTKATDSSSVGSQVRNLRNAADELRKYYDQQRTVAGKPYKTIIVVAPSAGRLSEELERDLIILDFPLPETGELGRTLNNMTKGPQPLLTFLPASNEAEMELVFGRGKRPAGSREAVDQAYRDGLCGMIAAAGRGLTMEDYTRGLHMFAVREREQQLCFQRVEDMLDLKAKAINNDALQYTPHVAINLGGLDEIKEWIEIRRGPVLNQEVRQKYRLAAPKGVMLCGVSGGGKSQLAKHIAAAFNLALLRLDIGALFGKYVGESEENTRRALILAELLAPVVLWLDELDKSFAGIGSSGGDNGVATRVFGHFLTWLAEKQDNVFVVATANDFRPLLKSFPEFGRKGRFDEIFWVPLPSAKAREEIFRIYLHGHEKYIQFLDGALEDCRRESKIADPLPSVLPLEQLCWLLSRNEISQNMTGAEIEYAIAEALYQAYVRDLPDAAMNKFDVLLIVSIVKRACSRRLYPPNDPELTDLQRQAERHNWIGVPKNTDGA